ncbi:hypothetical protein F5Y06DRAFT_155509 [Hypoxylon sp. FL0890]|nr:hypothetical protein F5Y06DRAFT_155509 [Hypoxylon sp. FL0890]
MDTSLCGSCSVCSVQSPRRRTRVRREGGVATLNASLPVSILRGCLIVLLAWEPSLSHPTALLPFPFVRPIFSVLPIHPSGIRKGKKTRNQENKKSKKTKTKQR